MKISPINVTRNHVGFRGGEKYLTRVIKEIDQDMGDSSLFLKSVDKIKDGDDVLKVAAKGLMAFGGMLVDVALTAPAVTIKNLIKHIH